jgi:hypothetical protein
VLVAVVSLLHILVFTLLLLLDDGLGGIPGDLLLLPVESVRFLFRSDRPAICATRLSDL